MSELKLRRPEEVIDNFSENILYDIWKIRSLSKNLFNKVNYSNKTALTVWIIWDWWIWKTSFMNLLLECLYEREVNNWKSPDNINQWFDPEINEKFEQLINKKWLIKLNDYYHVLKINSWLLEKTTIRADYVIIDYLLSEINKQDTSLKTSIKDLFEVIKDSSFEVDLWLVKVWYDSKKAITSKAIVWFMDKFEEIVNNFVWSKWKKIIIVIDDLDRIPPSDAIAIMDSVKLFLDNKNFIVFFLNDKRIVKEWLKEKFGNQIGSDISTEYLDKLMQIDIDLRKYLNTDTYKNWVEAFIENYPYIKAKVPSLINELKKSKQLWNAILDLWNFRKVKKLFRNLQVQGPSLYEDNSDSWRLQSVIKYLRKELLGE